MDPPFSEILRRAPPTSHWEQVLLAVWYRHTYNGSSSSSWTDIRAVFEESALKMPKDATPRLAQNVRDGYLAERKLDGNSSYSVTESGLLKVSELVPPGKVGVLYSSEADKVGRYIGQLTDAIEKAYLDEAVRCWRFGLLRRGAEAMEGWWGSVARFLVVILPATGLRPSEIRQARVTDINLGKMSILVAHPKGEGSYGRLREVPIATPPAAPSSTSSPSARRSSVDNATRPSSRCAGGTGP